MASDDAVAIVGVRYHNEARVGPFFFLEGKIRFTAAALHLV